MIIYLVILIVNIKKEKLFFLIKVIILLGNVIYVLHLPSSILKNIIF